VVDYIIKPQTVASSWASRSMWLGPDVDETEDIVQISRYYIYSPKREKSEDKRSKKFKYIRMR
jgi:hypothetical protein